MRPLKYLLVGAVVLAVTIAVWSGLTWVMGNLLHWHSAPVIAVGIIVVAGWTANGLLVWRQSRQGGPPPG
jgi:putative flippase GtrA